MCGSISFASTNDLAGSHPDSPVSMAKFTYPDKLLHELFREQADRTPERVAIIDPGVEPSDYRSMTYAELQAQSDTLALWLRHSGVGEGSIVPIYMVRCLEFALSYVSILKAGGAYLPLEIGYPSEMMKRVLVEVEAVVTLTMPASAGALPAEMPRFELGDGWLARAALTDAQRAALPPMTTGMDSLAYCVYSSGTTGVPKGITCPHRGSVFSYSHRMFASPYHADGSDREGVNVFFVWEMLRPLLGGASLVVIPDSVIYDPPALTSFLTKHGVTRQLYTPSLLEAVLDWGGESAERTQALTAAFASFRVLILCGEVVTVELRRRLLEVAPPHVQLLNLYSVSECHDVSMADLNAPDFKAPTGKYCPTGQLLPGVEVLIMSEGSGAESAENLKAVPLGMAGEIFVSGPTLGLGYLKRPELTGKRFPPRPSSAPPLPKLIHPGQDAGNAAIYSRLYDTGDWGRLLSDGSLEILGRHDSMQKIRGYSVELRAVEVALLACEVVTSCVVRAVGAEGTDKHIAAFVVYDKAAEAAHGAASALGEARRAITREVRASLKAQLPHYMVPSFFATLDELPTHPISGKLDTKAFPTSIPELLAFIQKTAGGGEAAGESAGSSPTEKLLTAVWAEVLELPPLMLDADESFFDQGGHSLRAARLAAKLTEELGRPFRVRALFDHPTIATLAAYIDAEAPGGGGGGGGGASGGGGSARIDESVLEEELKHMAEGRPDDFDLQLTAYWHGVGRTVSRNASAASLASLASLTTPSTLSILGEADKHSSGSSGGGTGGGAGAAPAAATKPPPSRRLDGEKVLLTGATGFLGAFLLRELLASTSVHTVFCIVRASTTLTATQRVVDNLDQYRIWNPEWISRLEVLEGDASLAGMGLSAGDLSYLRTATDRVVHAAAQVNLVFPYAGLRRNNVLATRHILHFCMGGKVKPLTYVSTDAVFRAASKGNLEDAPLREELPHLETGYAQSKCVAELLVQAAAASGLPTVIFRPGNMGGVDPRAALQIKVAAQPIVADVPTARKRALDAALTRSAPSAADSIAASGWNGSDSNFLIMHGCLRLGAAPRVDGWHCELTPVDFASEVIVGISADQSSIGKAFNLVNPRPLSYASLFDTLRAEGVPLEPLPYAEWRDRLGGAAAKAADDSPLRPLWGLIEPLEDEAALLASDSSTYDVSGLLRHCDAIGLRDGLYPPVDVELAREYLWKWIDESVVERQALAPAAPRTLLGQCAVITGASGGIGAAIARALAEAGAAVCLAARRTERINALADELHRRYAVRTCAVVTDVTQRASVKKCVATAQAELGMPVTILVNNAGLMHYTYMRNLHEDEWDAAVDVNCKGVLNGVGAVLPGMLERGSGHIINLSSDAGRKAFPGLAVYSGTKFFVEGMSQALRAECAGTGVKVTTIQPGDCKTELPACTTDEEARAAFAQPSSDRHVWLDPADVARSVVFAAGQPAHVAINEILVEPRDAPA